MFTYSTRHIPPSGGESVAACHHEESPTCKDPKTHLVHARSVPVRYSRLAPALSRVCEAVAHRRRVRLKLRLRRSARTCTVPPGQLVSFLTTTTARCRLPYLAHFPLRTSLASRHPHEHRTASSLSLVLCNNSSFHCTWAIRHSFRHPSLTYLPFFVPGDLDTPDASTTLHSTTARSWSAAILYLLPLRLVAGRLCSTRLSSHPSQPSRLLHG